MESQSQNLNSGLFLKTFTHACIIKYVLYFSAFANMLVFVTMVLAQYER